jgi:hypothetical protein
MLTSRRFLLALALMALMTGTRALAAQSVPQQGSQSRGQSREPDPSQSTQGLVPIPSRTYIGFNPIGLPADIGSVEIENAVAQGFTVGGVGSYTDVSAHRFTTFDFKVRYYPGDVVLRDYSIGGTLGYTRFSNVVSGTRQYLNAPTLGIILDRNWIYGRSQHFVIGTGVGVKRVLASTADRDRADVQRAVVTGRLVIGFAF